MFIVTTEFYNDKDLEHLGLVCGSSIESVNLGKDIMSGFKNLVGGELTQYHEMIEKARNTAIDRMTEDASRLNVDGIINIRFSSTSVTQAASEILVYGTAVRILED